MRSTMLKSRQMKRNAFVLVCLLLMVAAGVAQGQVQIPEVDPESFASPVTFPETTDVTIYVDPSSSVASDDNIGTADAPKRTLGRALADARDNRTNQISTTILLAPGTYREGEFVLAGSGATDQAPLIIRAMEPDTVIVSGSDVFSEWEPVGESGQIYSAVWPYDWGLMPNYWVDDPRAPEMQPIVRRSEMVFVDGEPLTQVLTRQELREGTFVVSESSDQIEIFPAAGFDPAQAQVEVAVRRFIFSVEGFNNVAFQGLQMQHAASIVDAGPLILRNCDTILIENSSFLWNNYAGVDNRMCNNVTFRGVAANNNGVRGLGSSHVVNLYIEDVENNNNNWRGDMGEWYDWDSGQKFLRIHNAIFRNYRAEGNQAAGLWLDYDVQNVLVEGAYLCDNLLAGLFIEAAQGPVIVRNSTICDNRARRVNEDLRTFNAGVFSTNSRQVLLENNTITNNATTQIRITEEDRFRTVENFQNGEVYDQEFGDWLLRDNVIVAEGPQQSLIVLPARNNYDPLVDATGNQWYSAQDDVRFNLNGILQDMAAWVQAVGAQDAFGAP